MRWCILLVEVTGYKTGRLYADEASRVKWTKWDESVGFEEEEEWS